MAAEPSVIAESAKTLELWGGHECTVNRVKDRWYDQTVRSGHEHRLSDLELFAGLGIRKLRYPALWERISPNSPDQADFAWTDDRLPEIRRLGMEPIVTLCHHGSGPRYTSLLHDSFAPGLARHAAAVAERYPSVTDYTPVNEPLTTARFSALYGFWYPHSRDEIAFWTALLNQTDATRLAMRAIRRINPAAKLVQTDDLGFCHASEPLQRNADFQNERRWMGWDLLCGMVVPGHALWKHLTACCLEDRLRAIADDPCPPDIIGVNHYLSSERFLDHRIEEHGNRPSADHALGECEGVVHVDVAAVRHLPDGVIGLAGLVEQAWQRYGIPIAITECHNACTREEQARWFVETWREAENLRRRGTDVRAVTAWSLLGSYDWDRMLTRFTGHYDPGVFDLRGGAPRPTMISKILQDVAAGRPPAGPALQAPGWWKRQHQSGSANEKSRAPADPLLIIGGDNLLSTLAVHACEARGLHYIREQNLRLALPENRPWALLDTRQPTMARSKALASACARLGIKGAFFTPDRKARIPGATPNLLAVEHDPVFTAWDVSALPVYLLDALDRAEESPPHRNEVPWRGVYGPALIDGVLDLLLDGVTGPMQLVMREEWSETQFASALASAAGHDGHLPAECAVYEGSDADNAQLPHILSVLERFVGDRRRARREMGGSRVSRPNGMLSESSRVNLRTCDKGHRKLIGLRALASS